MGVRKDLRVVLKKVRLSRPCVEPSVVEDRGCPQPSLWSYFLYKAKLWL